MEKNCKSKKLFNLIEEHIDVPNLLTKFNEDLKIQLSKNTEFDRDIMYFDAKFIKKW